MRVSEADWAMSQIMSGEATPAQMGAFLIALAKKGETVDEIVGFRDAILNVAERIEIDPQAVDVVGTGGDGHGTVNVSTMASVVIAASGTPVVKHGNRAASSKSGASDVLGALGVNLDVTPAQIEQVFDKVNIAFIFAGRFHLGFKHAASVRRELGVPTVFNILGPLCNPVRPIASAVGVADHQNAALIASVFATRGAAALVFRGDDGLDELTTTGHSRIWEVSRGNVAEHDLNPLELGLKKASIQDLVGGDAAHNAQIARRVFSGEPGAVRDIVLLNAAAGMVAYDLSMDAQQMDVPIRERLQARLETARETIDSGAAETLLEQWVSTSQSV